MPEEGQPYSPFSSTPSLRPMPKPPRLHWGWVLALMILTRGFFELAWLIVQSNWVRKVNGRSKAFVLSIVLAALLPTLFVLLFCTAIVAALLGPVGRGLIPAAKETYLFGIVVWLVLRIWTVFQLRAELDVAPINIRLGFIPTLLLGTIYFQYHLHDYDSPYSNANPLSVVSQSVMAIPVDNNGTLPPAT